MASFTAIAALITSISSFAFGIYQYRILHGVRVGEKANSLLRFACELRKKSEDVKNLVSITDDIPEYAELFEKIKSLTEISIQTLRPSKNLSWGKLHELEQRLLSAELETDLLQKQISEAHRFQEEVRAYNSTKTHQG